MNADLGGVVIDEMADTVMGNAAELRPLAEGANRGLAAGRKDAGGAETDNVGELGGEAGSGNGKRIHALGAVSWAGAWGSTGHEKARVGEDAGECWPLVDQLATANVSACDGKASGAAVTGAAAGATSAGMMP